MEERMEVWMRMVEKALGEINTKLDTALKGIDDHECRLRILEGKGGKRWEALVGQIIGLIAAGAVGWFLGQIK